LTYQDLSTPCGSPVVTATKITLLCTQQQLTAALVSGLSYTITPAATPTSNQATINITVSDLGNLGAIRSVGVSSIAIGVHTGLGVAGNSVGVTAGAVGAGAAAAGMCKVWRICDEEECV
jgi:hypothetical protein